MQGKPEGCAGPAGQVAEAGGLVGIKKLAFFLAGNEPWASSPLSGIFRLLWDTRRLLSKMCFQHLLEQPEGLPRHMQG